MSRRHRLAALLLLALVAAPAAARAATAEKLALWLDGRAAAALHATLAAAAGRPLVSASLVARELRHVRGATAAARATALATRLHATVLYAHVDSARQTTLVFAARGEQAAERTVPSTARSDVAAAARELVHGVAPALAAAPSAPPPVASSPPPVAPRKAPPAAARNTPPATARNTPPVATAVATAGGDEHHPRRAQHRLVAC